MKNWPFAFGLERRGGASLRAAQFAQFKTQGVTDTEIVVGTHMDLSGPIKSWGIPPRMA